MRDYAKIPPTFWTGRSGKWLRGHPEAQVVAFYLASSPIANMIGLYYLPLPLLCHETGLDIEAVRRGLARAAEVDFARYDEDSEIVWLPNAAAEQIGETLHRGDKQRIGILNELRRFGGHRFVKDFLARYADAYSLPNESARGGRNPPRRGSEGPSMALRSQDQDQDQKQDQDQDPPIAPLEGVADEEGERSMLFETSTEPPENSSRRKRAGTSGSRISADWKPAPETIETFRREGIDAEACVAEFVDYWLSVPGPKALKVDWEAVFRNRVRSLVARGEAPPWSPPLREYVPPPDPPDAVSPEEARANLMAIEGLLSKCGRLPFSDST